METTALLEELQTLEAEILQDDIYGDGQRGRAVCTDLALTVFTDGSRLDSGATGYSVVWQNGPRGVGIKSHMGYNQEAYGEAGAECSALIRALETATKRRTTPLEVTTSTDAQAAIRRIASGEPGPGHTYAIQARKHIATLRRAKPDTHHRDQMAPSP